MLKKLIKKIFALSIFISLFWLPCFAASFWDRWNNWFDFPYNNSNPYEDDNKTDIWNKVDIKDDQSIINGLLEVFWLNNIDWDHKFISYVRGILNIALWLLSMIALIMTIYTFYMMFFTENEAWTKKAKQNLIGIFIALAIIWLSWLIVSFIFWWYQSNWKEKEQILWTQITTFNHIDRTYNYPIYLTI